MARIKNVNEELNRALAPFRNADSVIQGITSSLGVPPGEAVTEQDFPVRGFFLRPTDEVFSFYAVTPGRFIVFEMAANGNSLTLTFPISRVRRVVEEQVGTEVAVTIEIDADRRITRLESEYIEGDTGENQRGGRSVGSQVETFSFYRLAAQMPDEDSENASEVDHLWDFALALRNALGE